MPPRACACCGADGPKVPWHVEFNYDCEVCGAYPGQRCRNKGRSRRRHTVLPHPERGRA